MAGMIALVMVFFHFMLAPYYTFTGGLLVANYLLHYVAPIIFLALVARCSCRTAACATATSRGC